MPWLAVHQNVVSKRDLTKGLCQACLQVLLMSHGQLGPGSKAVLNAGKNAVMPSHEEGAIAGADAVFDAVTRRANDC